MIKMKGNKMVFTGKDDRQIRKWAKMYGMSVKNFVTGTLWVSIMTKKRNELKAKGAI